MLNIQLVESYFVFVSIVQMLKIKNQTEKQEKKGNRFRKSVQ